MWVLFGYIFGGGIKYLLGVRCGSSSEILSPFHLVFIFCTSGFVKLPQFA
jgi:hypothetical protein